MLQREYYKWFHSNDDSMNIVNKLEPFLVHAKYICLLSASRTTWK